MSTKTFAGIEVEVNSEGYFLDNEKWQKEMAKEIAQEIGIELTEEHDKVLAFIRADYKEKGVLPTMRRIKKVGGIPTKDLYRLFPEGPMKKASLIAGLPKPASCI